MSTFVEKVLKGDAPDADDWSAHLREAHDIAPSMTPLAFANYRTKEFKNSYEMIAETVPSLRSKAGRIIDLACGDGHLIPYLLRKLNRDGRVYGIDMSVSELTVAKCRIVDPRVSFELAKAQELPVENKSVDHIVCHMAFMLMLPIEPVVEEISRVLRPGGMFSAITTSDFRKGLFAEIEATRFEAVDSWHPKLREARTTDPRLKTLDGLRELFCESRGFEVPQELIDFDLEIQTTPEGIWSFMKNKYWVGMLPDAEKSALREKLISLGERNVDSLGLVSFKYPMKMFTVRTRDAS